jgi:hypothetical protein
MKLSKEMREYQEQFYTNKFDNLDKMNQFHEKQKLQQLIQYKTGNLNSPLSIKN